MHSVALLTASYAKDIERFSLHAESIDTWLTGYTTHYVIVNDEDVPLFARFASDKRVIVPVSRHLPWWLVSAPTFLHPRFRQSVLPQIRRRRLRRCGKGAAGRRARRHRAADAAACAMAAHRR